MHSTNALKSMVVRAGMLAFWLVLPIVVALTVAGHGWPRAPLTIWVTWKALVFPHDWIVSRSAGGSEAIFSGSTAVLVAIGQWAVVAFAFGRLLHARSLDRKSTRLNSSH